ncbi:MAG: S41 family peptidase [Bdellovibrionales bacterium]|nr:S41 family peptidase [Bdellovibrionales bacterium]
MKKDFFSNLKRHSKKIIFTSLFLFALLASQWKALHAEVKERYGDLQLFAKVLNLVQQYYVEEVDLKKLIYGGIKGLLQVLDPHTSFLPPDIFKEFESETSGEFGGLGIEITIQKGVLTIISPIEDTPAWKAGIKAGDKLIEINGESTKGMSLAEAAQKMKGKMNSTTNLGIYREGFDKPKIFSITRAKIKLKSAKYTDLEDGFAYVKLTSFIENSYNDLEKAIKVHNEKYKKMTGLVLDLRRNPGGLLDQAVKISDLFLNEGIIVSTMGRSKKEKEVLYAKKSDTLPFFPMIVLIDEYSASASEILAGALKDNKRALLMGQRSFGKGSVQQVIKLGDGSGLKLTVARYYTPSGRSIQAEGISPDILIDDLNTEVLEQAQEKKRVRREQDIQGHLLGEAEEETVKKKGKVTENNGKEKMQIWWNGDGDETETKKAYTAKEKLFHEDFQVAQAYNYLKAWNTLNGLKPIEPQQKETLANPTNPANLTNPTNKTKEPRASKQK